MDDIAVTVDHVSKSFRLPHEKQNTVKSALIHWARGGRRSYERQRVLKDVSFEIRKGDFFAIVGRNGSGKSTMLKMLAGIYTPTSGGIQVNGKLTPFIELGVGFNPELTGRENVFLNGALLGFNRKEMEAMYDDIVGFAELEKFMDQKLKNYSSGMQVRLAFSIAIRAQSDILLLDEVLAVGDAAFQQKCFDYFEELREQRKTVIFVSHDMDAVRRFCTRAVYIKDGDLILDSTPAEVADLYIEENMQSTRQKDKNIDGQAKLYKLTSKIIEQTDDDVLIRFSYSAESDDDMYIGVSVLRDGVSIAEINTKNLPPLQGTGRITYKLNITHLNGGMYQIGSGLFRSKNAELLGVSRTKAQFMVRGGDLTRGGALKLADSWILK